MPISLGLGYKANPRDVISLSIQSSVTVGLDGRALYDPISYFPNLRTKTNPDVAQSFCIESFFFCLPFMPKRPTIVC